MNQKISRLAAAAAITTSLFVSSVFAQDAAPIADAPKAETPTEALWQQPPHQQLL